MTDEMKKQLQYISSLFQILVWTVTISMHILNSLTVRVYYIQMNYIMLFCCGLTVTIAALCLEGLWLKHFTKIISWRGVSQFLSAFRIISNTPFKSLSCLWHHSLWKDNEWINIIFIYQTSKHIQKGITTQLPDVITD
jgi:hypothetical protein